MLIRAQEMARYVEDGILDAGSPAAIGLKKAKPMWSRWRI